jgi:classical protein kinase C
MGPPGAGPGPAPKYSNLDLIKAETPHTPTKISRMLHQLEFKLRVEMQYKEGIDKMAKLYQADGDKKSRADAESKKVESERKIQLLQSALKRYKNLHILDDVVEEEDTSERHVVCFKILLMVFLQLALALTASVRTTYAPNLYQVPCRLLFRVRESSSTRLSSLADQDRRLNR